MFPSCPTSSSVGKAFGAARAAIAEQGALPVPRKLRNAVTKLMRDDGYGDGYQYPHELEGSYVPGETYLPDRLLGERFHLPSDQGLERSIGERLERLRDAAKKPWRQARRALEPARGAARAGLRE